MCVFTYLHTHTLSLSISLSLTHTHTHTHTHTIVDVESEVVVDGETRKLRRHFDTPLLQRAPKGRLLVRRQREQYLDVYLHFIDMYSYIHFHMYIHVLENYICTL